MIFGMLSSFLKRKRRFLHDEMCVAAYLRQNQRAEETGTLFFERKIQTLSLASVSWYTVHQEKK